MVSFGLSPFFTTIKRLRRDTFSPDSRQLKIVNLTITCFFLTVNSPSRLVLIYSTTTKKKSTRAVTSGHLAHLPFVNNQHGPIKSKVFSSGRRCDWTAVSGGRPLAPHLGCYQIIIRWHLAVWRVIYQSHSGFTSPVWHRCGVEGHR